jgi:hypothetical protein
MEHREIQPFDKLRTGWQKAGWLIRKLEYQKISQTDELFTAYCLPFTIYDLTI